jgi:hypothetical protein
VRIVGTERVEFGGVDDDVDDVGRRDESGVEMVEIEFEVETGEGGTSLVSTVRCTAWRDRDHNSLYAQGRCLLLPLSFKSARCSVCSAPSANSSAERR